MRRLFWVIAVIAALVLGGWIYLMQSTTGRIYLPSGTGLTAKQTSMDAGVVSREVILWKAAPKCGKVKYKI